MATPKKPEPAKGKSVATTGNAPPPVDVKTGAVPAFMQKDVGKGLENLNQSDYEMPRLKLLQGISPELMEFDGLKAGHFFHTLTEDELGEKDTDFTLGIMPIYIDKRYVLWRPREDGGGILARADDGVNWQPGKGVFEVKINKGTKKVTWNIGAPTVAGSGLAAWGTYDPDDPKSPPAATLCYVIVALLTEYPDLGPVAIMLQRSTVKVARKLMGKLRVSKAPIYGLKFRMGSVQDQNGNGDKFFNYQFTLDGLVEDEDTYNQNKMLHEAFNRSGVKVKDLEGADEAGDLPTDRGDVEEAAKGKF